MPFICLIVSILFSNFNGSMTVLKQLKFTYDGAFGVIFVTQNNALRDCFKLTTT